MNVIERRVKTTTLQGRMNKINYEYHYRQALMRACECADKIDLDKLESVYPEIVRTFKKFVGIIE